MEKMGKSESNIEPTEELLKAQLKKEIGFLMESIQTVAARIQDGAASVDVTDATRCFMFSSLNDANCELLKTKCCGLVMSRIIYQSGDLKMIKSQIEFLKKMRGDEQCRKYDFRDLTN